MNENFVVLLILVGVGTAVGIVVIIAQSVRIRSHGLLKAFRRQFSGGANRTRYRG